MTQRWFVDSRSPTAVAPTPIRPFIETIWFDSDPDSHRVINLYGVITSVGGMSDEAKGLRIFVDGRRWFEVEFKYLSLLWPRLYEVSPSIPIDRGEQLELEIFGAQAEVRCCVVLAGKTMMT